MKRLSATALAVFSMSVAGCQVLNSVPPSQAIADGDGGLISYYLPMTMVQIDIWRRETTNGEKTYFAKIPDNTGIILIPDSRHLYTVAYEGSIFSDDDIKITVDENGFLTSVVGKVTDQTLAVGEKLALAAISLAFGVPPGRSQSEKKGIGQEVPDVLVESILLNPNDDASKASANTILARYDLTLSVQPAGGISTSNNGGSSNNITGLYYRVQAKYYLTIRSTVPTDGYPIFVSYLIPSVNDSPILPVEVRRSTGGLRTTTLAFTSGMLRDNHIEKKSEALAVAGVPLDIAAAIVALPTEILQVKINQTTKEKELIEAQNNVLTAQKAAIDAQLSLIAARKQLLDAKQNGKASKPSVDNDNSQDTDTKNSAGQQ